MTFWDRPTPALTDRRSSEAPLLYMDLGHITTVADMERRPAAAIYLVRPRALPPQRVRSAPVPPKAGAFSTGFRAHATAGMMWFSTGGSFFYRGAAASVAPRKAPCGPTRGMTIEPFKGADRRTTPIALKAGGRPAP
jgi:hypothetical protein